MSLDRQRLGDFTAPQDHHRIGGVAEQPDAVTCWDIISGDVKPAGNVLIYDESGDHPALQAAEIAAMPLAKPSASSAPSSAAIISSKSRTVGLSPRL